MKISNLSPTQSIDLGMELPVSIAGTTRKITVGELVDKMPQCVVFFSRVRNDASATYAPGETSAKTEIVYDEVTHAFYACLVSNTRAAAESATYYTKWDTRYEYYEADMLRTDCIYICQDGVYVSKDGATLTPVVTQASFNEVASEDAMDEMIADGVAKDGQLYYTVEA